MPQCGGTRTSNPRLWNPPSKASPKSTASSSTNPTELVTDHNSPGAVGELTIDEALTKILSGTGLTFRYLDQNSITIVPAQADGGGAGGTDGGIVAAVRDS